VELRIVSDDRDPFVCVRLCCVIQRPVTGGPAEHFDLGEGRGLEAFCHHDVRILHIPLGQADRIVVVVASFKQYAEIGRRDEGAFGPAFVEVTPGIGAGLVDGGRMVAVLDRHDAVATSRQLADQGNGERGFPRVLAADYGDDAC
jgi:hypothetical protein